MADVITIKGTQFTFASIPSSNHDSCRGAATRPFRVKNLEAFVSALTDAEGEVFEGLRIHLIEGPLRLDEALDDVVDGAPDTEATVALSAEDGSWEVDVPGSHDGSIVGNMQALGKIVQPHLDDGQVAIFEFVSSIPDDVELGYAIHAINSEGKTYTRDEQSLVNEILADLGRGDADRVSDIRLYEV